MKNQITYVVMYTKFTDVHYASGRNRTYKNSELPATVMRFCETAKRIHEYAGGKYKTFSDKTLFSEKG